MFRADLHIHSRYSRATSKKLTLRNLAAWSFLKGIDLVATGDISHPKWREELESELIFNNNTGFYTLKSPLSQEEIFQETGFLPPYGMDFDTKKIPSFILQAEVSCIYKKKDKTRKIHALVYLPSFHEAHLWSGRLAKIGNIHSDGRPILGLDVKNLLEMTLEHENAHLIPAHIWTPWFSLFGSRSGFDSLTECFEDLTPHIFALETGLSSDPPMNRLWSELDNCTLISNSDAHSGENLGREVNIFHDETSYVELFQSLMRKNKNFYGTIEFFPEEGKYHLDGHRNCGICFTPKESRGHNNICPVCKKELTIGVLNRVESLADREKSAVISSQCPEQFEFLIPLPEILAQLLQCGVKTKKVHMALQDCYKNLGSELDILQSVSLEEISRHSQKLSRLIGHMRAQNVQRKSGFDGEFGYISLPED